MRDWRCQRYECIENMVFGFISCFQHCQCASMRLLDNQQFHMGQALKAGDRSLWDDIKKRISMLYITNWKNFKVIFGEIPHVFAAKGYLNCVMISRKPFIVFQGSIIM